MYALETIQSKQGGVTVKYVAHITWGTSRFTYTEARVTHNARLNHMLCLCHCGHGHMLVGM